MRMKVYNRMRTYRSVSKSLGHEIYHTTDRRLENALVGGIHAEVPIRLMYCHTVQPKADVFSNVSKNPRLRFASVTTYIRPTHVPMRVIPNVAPRSGLGLAASVNADVAMSIERVISTKYS